MQEFRFKIFPSSHGSHAWNDIQPLPPHPSLSPSSSLDLPLKHIFSMVQMFFSKKKKSVQKLFLDSKIKKNL